MKNYLQTLCVIVLLMLLSVSSMAQITERERPKEWDQLVVGARFMDRFLPMPKGTLNSNLWGAINVLPRYVDNGIEDNVYSYWGGNIVFGDDGQYHLFVCGWREDSAKGHMEWGNSIVYHAVCNNSIGPFKVKDVVGRGHNPEIFRLQDGRYVVYVIGGYYLADNLNGPWAYNKFDFDRRDRPIIEGLSNLTFAQREDGSYLMVCRGGGIWVSRTGLSTYNQISDGRVYPPVDGEFEDPVVWRDHIQYHLIVNDWYGRIAFYLRSRDGLHWVTDPGEAYALQFSVHEDGHVEDWFKYERIKVLQDKYGRAIQANFAVIDTLKLEDKASDNHSSKNISIPLNPGLLLSLVDKKEITDKTKTIRLKIEAEEGFNPHTDIDISSLHFGASTEVNFGRGCKVLKTKKAGKDLIVTFDAAGHGITKEEFAPKLIGKYTNGKMLYGYARLPWLSYIEPLLSARQPVFGASGAEITVENFGQIASSAATVSLVYEKEGEDVVIGKSAISALSPYGKTTVKISPAPQFEKGKSYRFKIILEQPGEENNVYAYETVPNPYALTEDIPLQNTIKIEPTDSRETIIQKASYVVPTPSQLDALQNEFIAFIHFGPNTFTRMEWGNGMEDPKVFDLKELDTDQWCEAMQAAGMKMVVITVKHHDGFVLWQSRYTKHGVMSTNFRDGKGDILKDLSESCRKYGLKLGVYLSPADLFQIENPEGLYGNLSSYTKRTIPREVAGRPFKNKTTFEFEVDDYNEYFLNQLFELLTEYGPIHEVWFDGAHPKRKGGQQYNYHAWKKLIRTLAPNAVIFGREGVRWCGNEAGKTRDTEWNIIPYQENPDTASHFADMTKTDLGSRAQLYRGKFLHYQQAETNTSIREGWFYRDDTHQKVRGTDDVFDMYERAVGGNSTFLLNIPPNREGCFSPQDVKVLRETGERIRETYGTNLLKGARGPKEVLDDNPDTYLLIRNPQEEILITMPTPVTINRLLIQEAIATHSERVEKHTLEAWIDGAWKEVATATNIGYKRILRFPEITTDRIRIRFPESRRTPAISNVTAHYYNSRPPQLTSSRDINGMVTIAGFQSEFGWKAHGEDIAANLNAGFKVYYTLDGKEPNEKATEYTAPFALGKGELKAIALLNGQKGPVYHERYGLIKKDWKLSSASSEANRRRASLAFDENARTYWLSTEGITPHFIAIDLGKIETINGFAYTPQKENARGMMAKGKIQISTDGEHWKDVERFSFGNLINDPSKRYHYLRKPVSARYVRIEATEIAADGKEVAIAELDIF